MPSKAQNASNLKRNLDYLNSIDSDYDVFNNGYQLNFVIDDGSTIAFYPSTNRWVYDTETYYGGAKKLIKWMIKRGF